MIAVLESVELRFGGGVLTAAVAAGATVLPIDVTVDYDEEGGSLELNGVSYDYVSVEDESVTLATGLTAAAEVDDPAWTLDAEGRREEEWVAHVDLRDDGDVVSAAIPTAQVPYFPEGDEAKGQEVAVELTEDGYRVATRPNQTPRMDATYTYVPTMRAAKGSNSVVAHNAWTTVTGWFVFQDDRITYNPATGLFKFEVGGLYDFRLGVTFTGGGAGNRAVRIRFYGYLAEDAGPSRMVKFPADAASSATVETAQLHARPAGTYASFEVQQLSGADLEIAGSNIFEAAPYTDCAIRWVGPL